MVESRPVKKCLAIVVMAGAVAACNENGYTVIQREESSDYWTRVVLQHNGIKYYANCNNFKAAGNYMPGDAQKTFRCDLHVGQTIECRSFKKNAPDYSGYDLILRSRTRTGATDDQRPERIVDSREGRALTGGG
jgi:hypothetical protein